MKYKKLTKDQILISIDRLTRFKKTRDKYLRVFTDIMMSNLIEPKLKKSDIEKMDYKELTQHVCEIFNSSLEDAQCDFFINHKLKDYENSKAPSNREPLLRQIFSIKNEYKGKTKTKVMRILGLKIKLK